MNKTQCPHCLTNYVISDEQLRISRGMVRCGTCKERFQADEPVKVNKPVFDPRNVFIEPIADDEPSEKPAISVEELLKPAEYEFKEVPDGPVSEQFIEPDTEVIPDPVSESAEDLSPRSRTQSLSELENSFDLNPNFDVNTELSIQDSVQEPTTDATTENAAQTPKFVLENPEDSDSISETQSVSETEHSVDLTQTLDIDTELPIQDSVHEPTTPAVTENTAQTPKFVIEDSEDLDTISKTQTISEIEDSFEQTRTLDIDTELPIQDSVHEPTTTVVTENTAMTPSPVSESAEDLGAISKTHTISEIEDSFEQSETVDINTEATVQDSVAEPTKAAPNRPLREVQQELPLPEVSQQSIDAASIEKPLVDNSTLEVTQSVSTNEDALINEVTQLVDKKLLGTNENVKPEQSTATPKPVPPKPVPPKASMPIAPGIPRPPRIAQPRAKADSFSLGTKKKLSVASILLGLLLLLIAIMLAGALTYQLWLKQMIVWPDDEKLQSHVAPLTKPIKKTLSELEITIPVRRNLSKLELLSARTEAHPTRPSTILLRVSVVNRAKIEQPLPWFELSLTDPDGRLVSRRSLSPKDYVHNNRISTSIGPNELKKVTIELLSFPKQATGYELKLLNK